MKVKKRREKKNSPLYLYLLQGQQALLNCKSISVGRPGDVRYTTPLPHPTTPRTFGRAPSEDSDQPAHMSEGTVSDLAAEIVKNHYRKTETLELDVE